MTTKTPKTLVHTRFLDAPPPHLPHTISSRTITSVATNTSRVSPTLCHILRAGGWTRAQRLVAGRLGDIGGGRPRAAPPGGGTGRCGGGRGGVGRPTRPPHPRPGRPSRGKSGRAARRHYRLIAPGSRGHSVQRPAANGRAAMAATEGEGVSVEVARRPQGPGCGFCEDPSALRDARCQPLPEAAAAAAAPPLPRSSSSPGTHSATTPPLRGACWEMECKAPCMLPVSALQGTTIPRTQHCSRFLLTLLFALLFPSPVPLVFWSHHL